MIVLSCDGIGWAYGTDVIIEEITFSVEKGDRLGIVGVNGTGYYLTTKSTGLGSSSGGSEIKRRLCKANEYNELLSVSISQSSFNILPFQTSQLIYSIDNITATWSSIDDFIFSTSDPLSVSVSAQGIVTGENMPGEASIKITHVPTGLNHSINVEYDYYDKVIGYFGLVENQKVLLASGSISKVKSGPNLAAIFVSTSVFLALGALTYTANETAKKNRQKYSIFHKILVIYLEKLLTFGSDFDKM